MSDMANWNPDDDDLLRELRAELSVEPSPEFAAKVRAKVAAKPARGWSMSWIFAAAGAAAAVIAVVLVTRGSEPIVVMPDVSGVTVAPSTTTASTAPTTPTAVPAASRPRLAVTVARAESVAAQPEVLVPRDQFNAIRQFMGTIKAGAAPTVPLAVEHLDEVTGELKALKPMEIPLVTIEPLPGDRDGRSGGRENR